jgi:murein L,D-transpeptidase YcbB/YkuD
MTEDIATPSKIWIITGESDLQKTPTGARSSSDIGGRLGEQERSAEVAATERSQVDVSKAIEEFQNKYGLSPDGTCGQITLSKLSKVVRG